MLLSDIFSIPFLICLAICILLIGCSSIYFYQRITQQDHKIASMVSLISSLAEDPLPMQSVPSVPTSVPTSVVSSAIQQMCPRISVSDDEDTDSSDSESNSDSSQQEEDDDDNSEYSETSSENEEPAQLLVSDFDILPIESDTIDSINEIEIDEIDAFDSSETKSIHLVQDATDFSIFKSINISDTERHIEDTSSLSYKKMSINKLREIAQQQGHSDVSKLKKPEILKLLGEE